MRQGLFHQIEGDDSSIRFRILAVGYELPPEISLGEDLYPLHWLWRPQFYILKVLREHNNMRRNNSRLSNYFFPSLWSLWFLFRLARNGISPFKGLISGRVATLIVRNNVHQPNFLNFIRNLLMMRSTGKQGLLLNDYSNFVEVKLTRNHENSILTGFSISLWSNRFGSRLRSRILTTFLPWILDAKLNLNFVKVTVSKYPAWHPLKHSFGRDMRYQFPDIDVFGGEPLKAVNQFGEITSYLQNDVVLYNGHSVISRNRVLLNYEINSEPQLLHTNWPTYFWAVETSNQTRLPGAQLSSRERDGTYVSSVNNVYHFLEDTLPQIEINNMQTPLRPLFLGGNLDPILRELASASSVAPLTFVRDEAKIEFESLTFFKLSNYRAALSSGEPWALNSHSQLIKSGLNRITQGLHHDKNPSKRIFIIRKKSLHRRLVNSKPLMKELKKLGFIFVVFEDHSMSERLNLLADCSVLIGESGAGMAHAYFINPKARVIEIRHPAMHGSFEHLTLSVTSGVTYRVVDGVLTSRITKFIFGKDCFKIKLSSLLKEIKGF